MKKLACIILTLCLLPVCAFGIDFDGFNQYAEVFGANTINSSTAIQTNGLAICTIGSQRVTFSEDEGELKRIFIEGDGIDFLAYSMAAIMMFDQASENYTANAGQLLSAFLLSRSEKESCGTTVSGHLFLIQKQDKGYVFTIGK